MNDRNGIWIEEKALAPRDPGTGDERLPYVAGGWFYDDGALRVRLRRSRTIAGIWKHGAGGAWRRVLGAMGTRYRRTADSMVKRQWYGRDCETECLFHVAGTESPAPCGGSLRCRVTVEEAR